MSKFKSDLEDLQGIIHEKIEKFESDLAEALLIFLNKGVGTTVIDDLKFTLDEESPEWAKLSLYFKFEEIKEMTKQQKECKKVGKKIIEDSHKVRL